MSARDLDQAQAGTQARLRLIESAGRAAHAAAAAITARDEAIADAHRAGASFRELARATGLSPSGVAKIARQSLGG